ncbi:hypothetical protein ACJMK2_024082 [Sinanodonta woodiana]|uniref:UBX domain-containing protein 1 n=1 Tax=Sinanodonta woodiana TaxID=1069815 RepID=A0ABD3T6U3_SINWO
MATQTQSVDDVIVFLMSMGFELQDCQDAIQYGKITVESAVEWLVAGKPGYAGSAFEQPRLKLRKGGDSNFEEGSNPFVQPAPIRNEQTLNLSENSIVKQDKGESSTSNLGQSDSDVVSRLHLNDEQRKIKEDFEHKKREEAKKEAHAEKKKQKEEHARILKEIADDRERQKLKGLLTTPSLVKPTGKPEESKVKIETVVQDDKKQVIDGGGTSSGSSCLIQIRFPDGKSVRQSFSVFARLGDVWNFMLSKEQIPPNPDTMCFIQPFPHREFSKEDMHNSLVDLGLTPTGSLVLQKKQTDTVAARQESQRSPENFQDAVSDESMEDKNNEFERMVLPSQFGRSPRGVNPPTQPSHHWGRGHSLGDEALANEAVMDFVDEEEEGPADQMPNMFGGRMMPPGMPPIGNLDMFAFGGQQNQRHVFQGVGQKLVPEGHPGHDRMEHHHRPAREIALKRAEERIAHHQPGEVIQATCSQAGSLHKQPAIHSLMQLCLHHISSRLNDPQHQIMSLSGISEELAQRILSYLLKEKLLKPKTLNVFIPCYLRRIILDCYPYTTNELLHAVRFQSNLSHLSLRSCSLITDSGLQQISGMKKLKSLNISGCQQLTNKCLPAITELPSLVSLNLEDTGVTDIGISQFTTSCNRGLQHLNLNKTAVTHSIFPHLRNLHCLKTLHLENTRVCSLSGIQELTHLETLNVAHTAIVTESLSCIVGHPSLIFLSIANTENITGDEALQYVTGLKLHQLQLPSRHTTTSIGMTYLASLPLTILDLANFINVGDAGMIPIGQIHSLKQLLLSNTKLTDDGMVHLKDLSSLEVLNIDRTSVSDVGAIFIGGFPKLIELSMSSTRVSSRFLLEGILNQCQYLTKLNLSRTRVSNKGVKCLELPSLTLLSLDGTKVTVSIRDMITGCPDLTCLSLNNLSPLTPEDEEEELAMES